MLKFTKALKVYNQSKFSQVPNEFSFDNLNCIGFESSLAQCPHVETEDCGSGEGAGLLCL